MSESFSAAVRFLRSEARLLEQRLFATLFLGEPAAGVVAVLRGYQNDDGGFGHGLEPDKRCPASLPIDVEIALQAYASAGADDPELLRRACDFLGRESVGGAVSLASAVIEAYPRAEHWSDWTYAPGLNPTAGLAGLLHRIGFAHPWRDEATRYCWRALESGDLPDEVHALSEVLAFLEQVDDADRAERHAAAVVERLTASTMFHLDPAAEGYGLTPLTVAPFADSRWRSLFTHEQIDGHLDHLAAAQQPDGGWPITWEPPSAASRLEWRGIVTLGALRTLTSYGRLAPSTDARGDLRTVR
ncbi:hypothetical protein ACIBSW_28910 [Actinoplanes sp. NPDC049668]|uniref:hypothetical protein n=1 Tax=unclassified Actinoplanes TaxID=2626549 RepID=UPI0033A227C8